MQNGRSYGRFMFHPVGQGLFYTGEIENGTDDFVFVYDCGGTNKQIACDAADSFQKSLNGKRIDLLVLSHLHEDHINGIETILTALKPDGRIVMPYIDSKLLTLYQYQFLKSKNNDKFLNQFYENPVGTIREKSKSDVPIYMVSSFIALENDETIYLHETKKDDAKKSSVLSIDGGTKTKGVYHSCCFELPLVSFDWEFRITQPFFDRGIYLQYMDYLKGIDNLSDLMKDSEALSHLKQLNRFQNRSCLLLEHWPFSNIAFSRSVLTGDLPETKARTIRSFLSSQGKNSVYQIPHHGAKSEPSVTDSNTSVVSYGIYNRYRHPDRQTLGQYMSSSCVYEINENSAPYIYNV